MSKCSRSNYLNNCLFLFIVQFYDNNNNNDRIYLCGVSCLEANDDWDSIYLKKRDSDLIAAIIFGGGGDDNDNDDGAERM